MAHKPVGRGLAPAVTTDKPYIFGGTKAPPYKERFTPFCSCELVANTNLPPSKFDLSTRIDR